MEGLAASVPEQTARPNDKKEPQPCAADNTTLPGTLERAQRRTTCPRTSGAPPACGRVARTSLSTALVAQALRNE